MKLIDNIPVFGELGSADTLAQIKSCGEKAEAVALMADNHLGYSMPIGGVAAYDGLVSPSGVGYDIACGNKAVLLDINYLDVLTNIKYIMDEVVKHVSFFLHAYAMCSRYRTSLKRDLIVAQLLHPLSSH